jgi:ferritin
MYCHKYPGIHAPASLKIFKSVREAHSTGSFLDKKYTRHNAVLTKAIKITQVEVTEKRDYERTNFCNWFLQAVHDGVLDPKLTFSLIRLGVSSTQNNR